MNLFKVVCKATGKTVATGFNTRVIAKATRDDFNGSQYENEDNGRSMPYKVTVDVAHWKY